MVPLPCSRSAYHMHLAPSSDPMFTLVLLKEPHQLFTSIPLVAEEDSIFVKSFNSDDNSGNALIESISGAITDKVNNNCSPLTHDDVLRAIDQGDKDDVSFDSNPANCWVLDPIEGTKGFLKGHDAPYVGPLFTGGKQASSPGPQQALVTVLGPGLRKQD